MSKLLNTINPERTMSEASPFASSSSSSNKKNEYLRLHGGGADTVIELLNRSYRPIPGPTRELLEEVRAIAWIVKRITNAEPVGIIGICTTGTGKKYLGFSPELQAAVRSKRDQIEVDTRCRLALGVDERILNKVEWNKGCAEKKLMSAALTDGEIITHVAVAEYPPGTNPGKLAMHMGAASAKESGYAPCESCQAAYGNYKKAKADGGGAAAPQGAAGGGGAAAPQGAAGGGGAAAPQGAAGGGG
ncbi:MAG TPA: hypothetical protein VGX50_03275, partial [Longimicrobium sp.]|nr:hypothetical protein [Longimicrobium sp.]